MLLELIARTKALVSDLDNFQYRKMRKLIYLDEQQLCAAADGNSLSEKHGLVSSLADFKTDCRRVFFCIL